MSDRTLLDAVTAALRRDLTDDEKGSVDHLAVGAAALIRGHFGQRFQTVFSVTKNSRFRKKPNAMRGFWCGHWNCSERR